MRKWLMVIGGGLLALVIIISGISVLSAQLQKRHEKQVATTFVKDTLSGKTDASYSLFSSTAQTTQSKDNWNTTVQKLTTFFKGSTPQFQTLTQSQARVVATYAISGRDGNYLMTVTLTKTKAGWQVLLFNSALRTN